MAKKKFSEDVLDELRVDLQRRFNYAQGYVDLAVKAMLVKLGNTSTGTFLLQLLLAVLVG